MTVALACPRSSLSVLISQPACRQVVRRTVRIPAPRSKSFHFRPQTSPMRNPSSICRRRPIFRGVGESKRKARRLFCSARVSGCGSDFRERGSRTQSSTGGIRCRCAAYLQMRHRIPRHSCAEEIPSGLWLPSSGVKIFKSNRSSVVPFKELIGKPPRIGSRYLCKVY